MNRKEVIQAIINTLEARNYLEIGVFDGRCFMEIRAPYKVAVDPDMKITFRYKLHAIRKRRENIRNQYKHQTSDAFFDSLKKSNPDKKFDVIFIDGLHTYKQTFIDIINALQFLHPQGAIILHDINPETEALAMPASSRAAAMAVHDNAGGWCGDSWKAQHHIIEINKQLNQLDVFTLDCDYGLGIIFPKSTFCPNDWKSYQPQTNYEDLPYSVMASNRKLIINLVEPGYITEYLKTKKIITR